MADTRARLTPEQTRLLREQAFAEFARRKREAREYTAEQRKLIDEQAAAQISWRRRLGACDPKDRKALEAQYEQDMEAWVEKTGRLKVLLASDIGRLPAKLLRLK